MVEVLDTWNMADSNDNVPDRLMDVFTFSTAVTDGRIQCRYCERAKCGPITCSFAL